MSAADELREEDVRRVLPERPLRFYPAALSSEADALAWAAAGADEGSIVVAGNAIAPRGHGDRPWALVPDRSVLFSLVVRPNLPPLRQGWLWMAGVSGIADVAGEGATIEWPADVWRAGTRYGAANARTSSDPGRIPWAVISVAVFEADRPRLELLRLLVEAVERRYHGPPEDVLADYSARCTTLGRRVCARLIPVGPGGRRIIGRAAQARPDGSLLVEVEEGRLVPVRPHTTGLVEDAPPPEAG